MRRHYCRRPLLMLPHRQQWRIFQTKKFYFSAFLYFLFDVSGRRFLFERDNASAAFTALPSTAFLPRFAKNTPRHISPRYCRRRASFS